MSKKNQFTGKCVQGGEIFLENSILPNILKCPAGQEYLFYPRKCAQLLGIMCCYSLSAKLCLFTPTSTMLHMHACVWVTKLCCMAHSLLSHNCIHGQALYAIVSASYSYYYVWSQCQKVRVEVRCILL